MFNPRAFIERKEEYRKTLLMQGASVGANATIVCGHIIGRYAFVGAGAVVTRDVPDYAMVYGNPARVQGYVCWCGEKLPDGDTPICGICGARYQKDGDGLFPSNT